MAHLTQTPPSRRGREGSWVVRRGVFDVLQTPAAEVVGEAHYDTDTESRVVSPTGAHSARHRISPTVTTNVVIGISDNCTLGRTKLSVGVLANKVGKRSL